MSLNSLTAEFLARIDISTESYDVEAIVANEVVFNGPGFISHITIWKDVDGGTIQLKDSNGVNLFPAGITDYGGSFMIRKLVQNGCRVTTTGFAGGRLSIFYST